MLHSRSAGVVLIGPNNQVAVVSQHGTAWSLVKGTLEKDEDDMAALRREVKEEVGISEFNVTKKLGTYERFMIGKNGGEDKSHHKTITFYLAATEQAQLIPEDPENPEARWVKPDEVADLLTHPKDRQFFLDHLGEVKRFIASR
ncbi:MAG TPA: NUDIX domain-containing protein [Candidatus Saccharimonadales bacterium]|nr:NUDIX domain-containing protein [Candidatus Saccharimonadales bacterium]